MCKKSDGRVIGFTVFILVVMSAILSCMGVSSNIPITMSVIWVGTISGLVIYIVRRYVDDLREHMIVLGAYFLRIALLLVETLTGNAIELKLNIIDWNMFGRASRLYFFGDRSVVYDAYVHVLSGEYHIFGVNVFIARFINIVCVMIALWMIYQLLKEVQINRKYRWIALLLFCFMPFNVINSISLVRESLIQMLMTASFYCMVRWIMGKPDYNILGAMLFSVLAAMLHSGSIILAAAGMILYCIYDPKKSRFKIKTGGIVLLVAALAALVVSFSIPAITRVIWAKIPSGGDLLSILRKSYVAHLAEHGGSEYLVNMELNSWGDFILYTPVRMLYFMLSPMPFDWRGMKDVAIFLVDSMLHLWAMWSAVKLLRSKDEKQSKAIVILYILVVIFFSLIFAWGTCSAGTAIRHRGKIVAMEAFVIVLNIRRKIHRIK